MCEFCDMYRCVNKRARGFEKKVGIKTKFGAKLVEYRVRNGIKTGLLTYSQDVKLEFCPTCGRNLREVTKNE